MITIEPYRPDHLAQVQSLVNVHLGALVSGWAVPEALIANQIQRNPGQYIVDPWVIGRTTLCAIEQQRVVAAAHLLRYGSGPEVSQFCNNTGAIDWLFAWPDAAEAAQAWQKLSQHGPEALTAILGALKDNNPVAANYLRSAFEAIADRTLSKGKPLPARQLEAFVKDTKRNGRARRLAYEWLVRIEPSAPERLLPGMLDDPGAELRRDAVESGEEAALIHADEVELIPEPGNLGFRDHEPRERPTQSVLLEELVEPLPLVAADGERRRLYRNAGAE